MAVIRSPGSSRFTLVRQTGTTPDGKPILNRKSYGNVKWDASDQDIYDAAMALGELSQHPVVQVERYDQDVLVNA